MTQTASETMTEQGRRALFVYGVIRSGVPVPPMTGVAGAPLTAVTHGPATAVVGEIDAGTPVVRKADLTAYHQVLDRLAAGGAVVPVRFGTALPDADGVVHAFLAPRSDHLAALLDSLDGRAQMVLRARYVEEVVLAEVVAADPAIRALNDRTRGVPEEASWGDRVRLGELVAHAMERRRLEDANDLLAAVAGLVVEIAEREGSGLDHVLDVALLVDDERRAELERVLEDYAEAAHERMRLSLVGPSAPYDFVGGA